MLKEALKYLVGLGEAKELYINGQTYSDKRLDLIEEPRATAFNVRSLSGLVEYLKSDIDNLGELVIKVEDSKTVVVFNALNDDRQREYYIKAKALTPDFDFERFYDRESFNIKLQSCFVKNEDRDIVLRVVGNIAEENVSTYGDDGVSQSVVAKTGIANVDKVIVPNPVVLKPFRTFVEVEQPASEFIFRMKNGPSCALLEADGGAWELAAMRNIKNYLKKELKEEIESGKFNVIA
ncbi:hypothetical protein KM908_14160 [Alkalihalobacillus clausii]|uniref:hypothetical protein n=1 Tax=Shouchella clausii TaxID=79880 RepID=UPI001C2456FD|nr:hypothetical protein [Shouchella clausii]MBU8597286.1 hypothetical protein [Shouchella clausii]